MNPKRQFSLRSLIFAVLLISASSGLWWRWQPWVQQHVLTGHLELIQFTYYSRDGQRILTMDDTTKPKVWNARTGQEQVKSDAEALEIMSALPRYDWPTVPSRPIESRGRCIADDGRFIFFGFKDGPLWNGENLVQLADYPGGDVFSVFFSQDGTLVSVRSDRGAWVWNARTGARLIEIKGGNGAFSTDKQRIVTGYFGKVWVCDTASGMRLAEMTGHEGAVMSARFSPDGNQIVSTGEDHTARTWTRRRPEYWWGIAWLPEFWIAGSSFFLLVWSVVRDRRRAPPKANK